MTDQDTVTELKVRWPLLIVFVLSGIAALVASFMSTHEWFGVFGELTDADAQWWSGLGVNVGSALLLAAILVIFERTLLVQVRKETKEAAQGVATQAAAEAAQGAAEETAARLIPHIEDLNRLARERAEGAADQRVAAATRIGQEVTHEAILDAFRAAESIHAVGRDPTNERGAILNVPAGNSLDSPVIVFDYWPYTGDDYEVLDLHYVETPEERSVITWQPDETPEEVFERLSVIMMRDSYGRESKKMLVGTLFENLSAALRDAIEARSGSEHAWLSGNPLREVVADGWAITDSSIEVRDRGPVMDRANRYSNLPAPDGLDEATWEEAVLRFRRHP